VLGSQLGCVLAPRFLHQYDEHEQSQRVVSVYKICISITSFSKEICWHTTISELAPNVFDS
jgi:hypothetical protein